MLAIKGVFGGGGGPATCESPKDEDLKKIAEQASRYP